jgi:phosphatidylglycerol lysyltransferase
MDEVRSRLGRFLFLALPVAVLVAAGFAIHRELAGFSWADLQRSVGELPRAALALAAVVTAVDYLLLSGYDLLALRYAGRTLPFPRVLFTSFISYAFGNNVGFSLLSSSSVRLRLYSQWGLTPVEVTRVVAFTAAQLWAGLLPILGVALLTGVPLPVHPWLARLLGVAALAATGVYLLAAARVRREVRLGGLAIQLPSLRLAAGQVLVSAADWAVAALVLFVLLPEGSVSLPALIGLFVAAQVAGLASQVPGGIGVFDSVVLAALSASVGAPRLLAALLAYRSIYYLAPFLLGFLLLVANELVLRRALARRVQASLAPVVPWVAAAGALVAGTVLLASGATPTLLGRLHVLRHALPLPVLEVSHLLGSLVGTALLLLARSLARRLDGAWVLSLVLLAAGAVLSLAKGLDWEEASLLTLLLLALLPFRAQFYRRSSLLGERVTAPWVATVILLVAMSVWIGFFSYRYVEYSSDLWFTFAFHQDAPRFLRGAVAGASLVLLYATSSLLRPAPAEPSLPGPEDFARARAVVDRSPESVAHLALLGDKPLLFSTSGDAFLMYAVEGRSWVAMGDPIGGSEEATELAWQFRELGDAHHGWTCFYQVGEHALPRYLDMGLSLLKLGEEAVVPLGDFQLEGSERRALRQAYHRGERDGLSFEVLPADAVPNVLPALRNVSDAWLAQKKVREKGFSLGYFQPEYLCQGPAAVARKGGEVVAFANMWTSSAKAELSVDLMRFAPAAPRGTMDFLLVSILLWGRTEGYQRFNLGMAPFSGFEARALAPTWTKLGALLFRFGDEFYNFQGLRQYKEKFAPEWHPRYLAAPGGLRLPFILTDIAALVGRGLKGVVKR